MSTYQWALFLHLLGAFLFFAGLVVAAVAQVAALRRERPSEVAALLALARSGVVLVGAGTVLVLVFGLWLADLAHYGLGDEWVVASLALFVVASALGAVGGRKPKEARLLAEHLAGEGDASSPELKAALRDRASALANSAAAAAAIAVLVLMTWKPGAF